MKNYRKQFARTIQARFPDRAEALLAATEKHYRYTGADVAFGARSPNPIDKRLDFSAYFLAFIKALDEQGESFEVIREVSLEVVTTLVKPKNSIQRWFKKLPAKLVQTWIYRRYIRSLQKRVKSNPNPDGFVANIITDKKETYGIGYGIDIIECGICKLFKKHDAGKYASILCEVDELTSALAGLELIRSGTIANGAAKCDFRYKIV